jgi:hypothetical protein
VPAITQPGAQDSGATALEKSLGALPESLQQAGSLAVQTEELQARRQRVFDTLNGQTAGAEIRVPLQTLDARLRQENWQTAPGRFEEEADKLIREYSTAQKLSPQAHAIFYKDAKEYASVLHGRATEEMVRQTKQQTAFATATRVQQAQEDYANATNTYERTLAWGRIEEGMQQLVEVGAVGGTEAATVLKKTSDSFKVQTVQTATQAEPDRMKQQLQQQSANVLAGRDPDEGTDPALPLAPLEHLAKLTQEATETSRARFAMAEHLEQRDDRLRKKQQERNSIGVSATLFTTPLTPDNVPTFEKLRQEIGQKILTGEIERTTGEHLIQTSLTLGKAASAPRQTDDLETERIVRLMVHQARTPEQFAAARQALVTIMEQPNPKLKPETFSQLDDKLTQREKGSAWREQPQAKAGNDILMRGALVPYGGTLAGQLKPQMQQKLIWAKDAWEQQMQTLYERDPQAAEKQAVELAWQARIQFLKPEKDDPAQEYIPPEAQAAKTRHELAVVVSKLRSQGWADGSLAQIVQNWHTWQDYEQARRERQPQGQGRRSQPPSYTLPGTGGTPTTEPRSR